MRLHITPQYNEDVCRRGPARVRRYEYVKWMHYRINSVLFMQTVSATTTHAAREWSDACESVLGDVQVDT